MILGYGQACHEEWTYLIAMELSSFLLGSMLFNPSTLTFYLLVSEPGWVGPDWQKNLIPPNMTLNLAVRGTTVALGTRGHRGRRPWEKQSSLFLHVNSLRIRLRERPWAQSLGW